MRTHPSQYQEYFLGSLTENNIEDIEPKANKQVQTAFLDLGKIIAYLEFIYTWNEQYPDQLIPDPGENVFACDALLA